MDSADRRFYGETILRVLQHRTTYRGFAGNLMLATNLCNSKNNIKRRLLNIMKVKQMKKSVAALASVAGVLIVGISLVISNWVDFSVPVSAAIEPTNMTAETSIFPINENGQTFCDAQQASSIETLPDLMFIGSNLVTSVNGDVKNEDLYIYTEDVLAALPKTESEALAIGANEKNSIFTVYKEDGKTIMGEHERGVHSLGAYVLLPSSVRQEFWTPIYPVNANGQTYGLQGWTDDTHSPDLIPAMGIDGTEGYINSSYSGHGPFPQPNNPEEAEVYMQWLHERQEEIKVTGEKYIWTIPLYASDGVTVIGEYGISPGV
jgi:hypothetical protein